MRKFNICLSLLITFVLSNRGYTQDWTRYVRTSGHGVEMNRIHAVMDDARQTHLFGIEVDNDITGRYSSFLFPEPKLRALKAMADSAHAAGNFAFVYTAGLECITDSVLPESRSFFRDHPDWLQRNIKGDPAVFGSGAAFWISKNSEDVWISPFAPEWRKLYMERIRQITATGIDGVYIDIPYWMTHFENWEDTWASFDSYTVAEFKKRTGINALTDFKPGDWNDPEFIAWVDFRISSLTGFMAEIDANVKSVNPGCKTIAEIYPGIGEEVARVGADVYEMYPVVDVIAHEFNVGENSALREPVDWMEYMIGMYTFRAFAEGKPSWMLSYSWDGQDSILPADAIENLAMSQVMAGTNCWDARRFVMSGSNDYVARTRVYKWIAENEKLIYSPRKTMAPVGIYFSPKTRNYFPGEWIEAYLGLFNLLLQQHIEFEIITPRTLSAAKSSILILPDVKCLSDKEYSQLELYLKNGNSLISTGETGFLNDKRERSVNQTRMQDLSRAYPKAILIAGNPTRAYYHFLKNNYNKSVYQGASPIGRSNEINQLLNLILTNKGYSPAVEIENTAVGIAQIASVNNKPTVFLSNFAGLKGGANAKPFPDHDICITFNHAERNAQVLFIPFLGQPQKVIGKWENGKLKVTLPVIYRGAIVQLQ
ncbi:MAG: hypothetical protein NTV01_16585 [Bacteroidia bacterium]|nr:hypothetical protein [Bacteroidia bacterium]